MKHGGAYTCKFLAFQNVTFLCIQYTHFISRSSDVKWLWLNVSPGHSKIKHFSVAWRHTRDPALQSQPELCHMLPFVKVTPAQSKMLHTSFKSGQSNKAGWMCLDKVSVQCCTIIMVISVCLSLQKVILSAFYFTTTASHRVSTGNCCNFSGRQSIKELL